MTSTPDRIESLGEGFGEGVEIWREAILADWGCGFSSGFWARGVVGMEALDRLMSILIHQCVSMSITQQLCNEVSSFCCETVI